MRDTISDALKAAIKSQDKRRISTLRLISAAIKDRDIAARSQGKDPVGEDEILEILSKMIKQRHESIKSFEEGGRPDLARQEQAEIEVIRDFLPRQLSESETRSACVEVVEELGCEGLKDMGKTMAKLKERYPGQMDFSLANRHVKELLK